MTKIMPVSLSIPANAEHLDVVRAVLYAIASKAGFSFEEIEDMKVAVTEACTNAVLHAYKGQADAKVDIAFYNEDDSLSIVIKDNGGSFQPEELGDRAATLHDKPLAEAAVGGLGLFLMQALMDEVEIHTNEGTRVVLVKHRSRNGEMV